MGIVDRFLSPWVERRAATLMGGWVKGLEEGAYDSTYDFEFSAPYQQSEKLGFATPTNIREWTITERKDVLLRAHLAWERNPLAKGAIRIIRGFVVSTGLSITYRNTQVKEVLERFRSQNRRKVQRWERHWFDQLLVDGEVFVRVFSNRQRGELSSCDCVSIKPWLVEYVESEEGNRDNVVAYHARPETGTGEPSRPYVEQGNLEPIPADEIVHCYINAFGYETRGRSELFAILPWLRAYREWLENRARLNRYKGFLYHLQLQGATPGQVSSKRSAFKQPPAPGAVYVSSDREILKELGGNTDAGRVAEDGRQIKLMNLSGLSLPEYMLSEGQNANLATARSQQLPALRAFLTYQDIYCEELWRPLYEAVLQQAGLDMDADVEEENSKGESTGRKIPIREAFEIHAQQVVDEDPKDLAEALTLAQDNGWASKQTLAARAGYDWDKEQELLAVEDKEEVDAVYQGRKLGNTRPPVVVSGNGKNEEA